jgi:hypothetical protein
MYYYKIKYGATLDLMLIGLTILLFSIILFNFDFFIAFVITFIIGITVLLSIKGIIIKSDSLKIYFSFLGLKIGKWIPINKYSQIYLSNLKGNSTMNSRGRSLSVRTNSFVITLQGENLENIELYEDTNYKESRLKLLEIQAILKIKAIDQIDIIKNRLKEENNYS